MRTINETVGKVHKHFSNGWTGETFTTVNGQQFEITTLKRSSGKIVSSALKVEASESGTAQIVSFSLSDMINKSTELISRSGRATESTVKAQHAEAVLLFDQKAEAGEINGLDAEPAPVPEIGTIIFLDGYGKTKGSEGNKKIVFDIERTQYGTYYRTVEADTLKLGTVDYPKPFAEKFGIGNYFEPGYKFEGTEDELNNLVIEAQAKAKADQEAKAAAAEKAEAERLKDIEEGKKLVNIPQFAKSVIVADLYEDQSDVQTDYFHARRVKRVFLAWSRSDRNNMKELKKAASGFEKTKELTGETTRGHYALPDYHLGEKYNLNGWKVHKLKDFFKYRPEESKELLYIAAANGRYIVPEETKPEPVSVEPGAIEYIDYSAKAFAIIGDTKPIKDTLKSLGGRWNNRLSCGPGWIFSKAKSETEVKKALNL